jgi:hypothetical protein
LSRPKQKLILEAAPMHDVGKIGIPDYILLKPGKLTPEEFEVMKGHSRLGFELLQGSGSEILRAGAEIAVSHHEKYDGSGYPKQLKGNEIPLYGRIVAVADVFDALTSERPLTRKPGPWKMPLPSLKMVVVRTLIRCVSRHFSPVGMMWSPFASASRTRPFRKFRRSYAIPIAAAPESPDCACGFSPFCPHRVAVYGLYR